MDVNRRLLLTVLAVAIVAVVGIVAGVVVSKSGSSDDSPSSSRSPTRAGATPSASEPREDPARGGHGGPTDDAEQGQVPDTRTAIVPDPDFEEGLREANISRRGWKTDFSLHSVSFDEILSGGVPRDGMKSRTTSWAAFPWRSRSARYATPPSYSTGPSTESCSTLARPVSCAIVTW